MITFSLFLHTVCATFIYCCNFWFPKTGNIGSTRYCQVVKTKNFAEGTRLDIPVALVINYIEYSYNNFRQINSVESCWTIADSSGDYIWNEAAIVYTNKGFPRADAEAHARGSVSIAVDTSNLEGIRKLK